MSTTFILFCVLSIAGMLCVTIYYAHKVDTLTTDNDILKRRNETLERRFSHEEEQASVAEAQPMTGVEILHAFAQSHQVRLEHDVNYNDDYWELYYFTYQVGRFYSYVGKLTDEVLIRFAHFDAIPYSDDAFIQILRLCDDFTANSRFVKLTYSLETNDMGEKEIQLHLYYDLIGVSEGGIEFILNSNFAFAREVINAMDVIRKAEEEQHPADNKRPKTEEDYQAMAIQMALKRNND